ncbi:MAG: 2,3-bisphosphoglycerate-independent phosphoglycerate mutase [Acidobacteriota bacterium]|nr:MAG: 2,3-bisphosphoglycerate-independent phosphoglycerate mutase [Acidobacteriota bacterium]
MSLTLRPSRRIKRTTGPLLLAVLDGIGLGRGDAWDAVKVGRTPTLDWLRENAASRSLRAHGTAVGLPSDDDMGNSEVGHNALGAGRIVDQGAKLVNQAIADGSLFESDVWRAIAERCQRGGALHLIGLLSDGNVHSHQKHLHALIEKANEQGFPKLYVHTLLDGRDVPERSALTYVERLERLLAQLNGGVDRRYRIASGGGRMVTTMDRYEADWSIVERGWKAHVHGEARRFASATEAIETYRREQDDLIDQFMSPFVITDEDEPVGPIRDGDAVVFFNFRGDRALEISRAFEEGEAFNKFDRGRRPDVLYAGMTLYDGDLQIPKTYLVPPPAIDRTLGEYLARAGVTQFALSETQKYGHVTYFWNGNRGGQFDAETETYVEIPSDRVPFEQRPWMKAAEITDKTLEELRSGRHRFLRINYPNGDMVGHTGRFDATVIAVETVDLCLARLMKGVDATDATLIVLADHGNADDMAERDKKGQPKRDENGRVKSRTSHSLNAVPFIIYRKSGPPLTLRDDLPEAGLANVAASVLELLGFEPPEDYLPSLLA